MSLKKNELIGWLLLAVLVVLVGYACRTLQAETVTLRWTSPGDDMLTDSAGVVIGATGTPALYRVYFALDSAMVAPDSLVLCAAPGLVPAGLPQVCELELSGLLPDTVYWVTVRALDNAGNIGDNSNRVSVRTPDKLRPAAILDLEWLQ